MNKLYFLGLSFVVPTMCMAAQKERPNIILIMADDMGWGDVGFNGNSVIKTPNLDALAADGMVMERFYSACAESSPTRASVLTGRHPYRTGVFFANGGILRKEETTAAELLKEQGYATGLFGKWHLGTLTYKERDANRGREGNVKLYNPPVWHGFDCSFVTESKVPTYDPMIKPVQNNGSFWDYIREGEVSLPYGTSYWERDDRKVTENVSGDDSKIIMDRFLPFIDESVEKKVPFFSVVWFHAPHLPCVAGPEHVALYPDMDLDNRNYYGCITALDEQIGRLVKYLKAKNIYENSIIFFCSDNGPELKTPGSPGNFRGKKRSLHEGGIRVPGLMCWPAKIPKGSRTEFPCSTWDYMPTLLDITGISKPQNLVLDGESFWPKLMKKGAERTKPMIFCLGSQGAVIDNNYKLYYTKGKYELYDMVNDSQEKQDIASLNSERVDKMVSVLNLNLEDYRRSFEEYKADWEEWWDIFKK